MKKIFVSTFIILFFLFGCKERTSDKEVNSSTEKSAVVNDVEEAFLKVAKKKYNFGKISRRKDPYLDIDFELENLGKIPLVITKVDVSCGCLSVNYSKLPLYPGKKNRLTVHIDMENQEGVFNKVIFVKSNARNNLELIRIIGEVDK